MMILHTCVDVIPSLDVDQHVAPDDGLVRRYTVGVGARDKDRSHREGVHLTCRKRNGRSFALITCTVMINPGSAIVEKLT